MIWAFLADAALVAHGAFVLFVVFGGLLSLHWTRGWWVHVPCALWGSWVALSGWVCPLTPLENQWRQRAGQEGYAGGFIEHYVTAALYPDGLTRTGQIGLGVAALAFNLLVYWAVWRRRRSGSAVSATPASPPPPE